MFTRKQYERWSEEDDRALRTMSEARNQALPPPLELAFKDEGLMSKIDATLSMTIDQLGADMINIVPEFERFAPPARFFDKHVYSPWTAYPNRFGQQAECASTDTLLETSRVT
jgi:hypothetical protein